MSEPFENPTAKDAKDGDFVVDGSYIKDQAGEAISLFFAPLSGVYRAAMGNRGKLAKHGQPKKVA